jgi:leucine efflux protein
MINLLQAIGVPDVLIDPARHKRSFRSVTMGTVISRRTLFYGSLPVVAGNAAARRLARNRRIAALAPRSAAIFLNGFGIKLTTN